MQDKVVTRAFGAVVGNLQVKKDLDEHMLQGVTDPRFPLVPQRIVADLRYVYRKEFRDLCLTLFPILDPEFLYTSPCLYTY